MRVRTYSEMIRINSFEDRYEYLKLDGIVGQATFGFDRYVNQSFYKSFEWRNVRDHVILRDNGCDLAFPGYEINTELLVHHMNPVSIEDIVSHADWILDPNFLITTTQATHNAIHYGDRSLLVQPFVERRPGDTRLW